MSYTQDILTGYAQALATAGVGVFTTTGAYQTTDTGIFLKIMPDGDGVPDRCVVLNLIPMVDDPAGPWGQVMMQVAFRGVRNDPLDVDVLADAAFNTLQGRTGDMFGDTTVTQLLRKGAVPMGQDTQGRYTRADKYFADYSTTPTPQRPAGGWD